MMKMKKVKNVLQRFPKPWMTLIKKKKVLCRRRKPLDLVIAKKNVSHKLVPQDVWELLILPKLGLQEYVRFAAVCRSWRSVAVQNLCRFRQLPWMTTSRDKTAQTTTFFSLSESKFYTIQMSKYATSKKYSFVHGSSQDYLIIAEKERSCSKKYMLVNPFSKSKIFLPKQCVPLYDWGGWDGQNIWVDEFSKILVWKKPGGDNTFQLVVAAFCRNSRFIAMCRPEDNDWSCFGADKRRDYDYMSMYSSSSEDEEKTQVDDDTMFFSDALFYKEKLYGVTTKNRLHTFELLPDSKTLAHKILNLIPMKPFKRPNRANRTYLVESQGKLLMVYRFWTRSLGLSYVTTTKFIVYELVESSDPMHWTPMKSLGDHMLFLGQNASVSISVKNSPGFKGNCIYFTHDEYSRPKPKCLDNGIFYLDDEHIESFLPPEYSHPSRFEPMWIMPDVTLRGY